MQVNELKMKLIILSALLAIAGANELLKTTPSTPPKRTYVCPPDFIRLGNKCYFFSNTSVKWDDAFFHCNEMHSTLAILRSKYQHKLLRNLLTSNSKYSAHLERWIGGRYDWVKNEWLWGASGKTIEYNGFSTPASINITDTDAFQWRCIILDPEIKYSWNHRSCYKSKNYICQTKLRNVNRKQKMKLRKLYKNKKLNEVPVPEITNNAISTPNLNTTDKSATNIESNYISNTAFASRPKNLKKRRGRGRGKGRKRNKKTNKTNHTLNGTLLQDAPVSDAIPNNLEQTMNMVNRTAPKKLHWKTYYKGTISPYHPRSIVEEFDFQN